MNTTDQTTPMPPEMQKLIEQQGAEPPTAGRWVYAANLDGDSNDPIHLLVAVSEGSNLTSGKLIDDSNSTCVAHFHRPADARRVVAAMRQLQGISTQALETMPVRFEAILMEMLNLRVAMDTLVAAAKEDESWAGVRAGILAEMENKPKPH